jgi:hypothetical protein
LIILAASCETLNVGTQPDPNRFQITGVTFNPAGPFTAGDTVTATINFTGVSGPFSFTATFSDCVTPATQTVTAPNGATSATLTFTLDSFLVADDADGKDCTVTVNGSDALGSLGGPVSGTFHVDGIPDQFTVITAAATADCEITVTVADADNEDVTVTATTVDPAVTSNTGATVVAGGNGTATFNFSAADLLAGGTGSVTFTATTAADTTGQTASATVTCPAIALAADTLYAIPLQTNVNAGDRVRVVVATGDPANPFQYLTGARVTIEQGADALYVGGTGAAGGTGDVPGSFNVGAVGGQAADVDGFWTNMNPTGFLLAPDNFIQRSDAGGGLHGIDFNVTPLGGSDVTTGEGELFNFELEMTNAGTWTLGFQDVNVVSRTYYQDGNQAPDYFWGDITNNHAGVPNSITVN